MDSGKRRKGPPPTGKGVQVVTRLHPADLTALDEWRRAQPDIPTRPEALRRLFRKALAGE